MLGVQVEKSNAGGPKGKPSHVRVAPEGEYTEYDLPLAMVVLTTEVFAVVVRRGQRVMICHGGRNQTIVVECFGSRWMEGDMC